MGGVRARPTGSARRGAGNTGGPFAGDGVGQRDPQRTWEHRCGHELHLHGNPGYCWRRCGRRQSRQWAGPRYRNPVRGERRPAVTPLVGVGRPRAQLGHRSNRHYRVSIAWHVQITHSNVERNRPRSVLSRSDFCILRAICQLSDFDHVGSAVLSSWYGPNAWYFRPLAALTAASVK